MRRILTLAVLLAAAAAGLWGQSAAPKPAGSPAAVRADAPWPPEIKKIKERGTLIVAMYSRDVIPYIMTDSAGNLAGNDVDLARNLAKALKVGIEIDRSAKTFNEIVDLVAGEKADIGLSLISRTLARAEKVRFSDPYVVVRPVLVLNRLTASRSGLDGPDPLAQMPQVEGQIAEPKGNSYIDFAKASFPKSTVVEYPTWDDVFNAVFEGKALATLRDEIGVKNYLMQHPERSVQLKTVPILDPARADPLGIAVPSASTHLLDWINLYLELYYPTRSAEDLVKVYDKYYKK